MTIFKLISKTKIIFKIFGILMSVVLIFYSHIHNSANNSYGDNYRQMANQNNSLASLKKTAKKTQTERLK